MAEQHVVNVAKRETVGKNPSRRLRREGRIPATLYGEGKEPVSVSVDRAVVDRLLHSEAGENTIFELALEGTDLTRPAMVKDYQLDPVTDRLMHADFVRIQADQRLQLSVQVELEGTPAGVKVEGGRLDFPVREVEVECLPKDIPAKLTVDVSGLHVGQTVRAGDLPLPPGVALLSDPELALASLHAKVAEEEAVEEEGLVPGAEPAPAAGGEEAPSEPTEG
jgi:large subunit ribosomal protein L25